MQERARKLLLGGGAVGALSVLVATQRGRLTNGARAHADPDEVLRANDRFYSALNRMFEGDLDPMAQAWSHEDDATLMDPFGGRCEGWPAIRAEFERVAATVQGGQVEPKDVLVRTDGDLGYVVCVEAGHSVTREGRRVRVEHRATSVFRREGSDWRMIHHHTDLVPRLQKARKEAEAAWYERVSG